jgi:hypothetical protein
MMIGMEKQEAGTEIRSTATSSNTNLTWSHLELNSRFRVWMFKLWGTNVVCT